MRIWRHICLMEVLLAGFMWVAVSASAADANTQQITGAHLQNLFAGKTVVSEYQDIDGGIKDFRFTEHHFKDGSTDYIERGQKTEKGRYCISSDRCETDYVCFI